MYKQKINSTTWMKYLGNIFTDSGKHKKHIAKRCAMATAMSHNLKKNVYDPTKRERKKGQKSKI